MSGRLDRTSGAATLLVVLGAFAVVNAVIGIAGAEWYGEIVLDVMDRSLGAQSEAVLEYSRGFTSVFMQLAWIIGLAEGVLNWLAAAAVLIRPQSWGRIAGLVIAALGLFGAAYDLLTYAALSQWTAPLPAFAWLDHDLAVLSSLVATAVVVAGYVATLVLLGRGSASVREVTAAVA